MELSDINNRNEFSSLLFAQPTHFRVEYEINPYMVADVNVDNARKNWFETIRCARKHAHIQTVDYDTLEHIKKRYLKKK